jgi:hypothetical protein
VLSRDELDALLKSKWEGMKAALVSGNIKEALTYFTGPVPERYRQTFTRLQANLHGLISSIESFHLLDVTDELADAEVFRTRNGVTYSFPVTFVKDRNGLWKIQAL